MTDNPTPEQIEAGKAAVLANFHPPTDVRPTWHLDPEAVVRAVLKAVASAGTERGDRYSCADLGHEECDGTHETHAPVQVDEEELAAFLSSATHAPNSTHSPVDQSCQDCPWPVAMLPIPDLARELANWLRGGG